jgi:hypothetical protein
MTPRSPIALAPATPSSRLPVSTTAIAGGQRFDASGGRAHDDNGRGLLVHLAVLSFGGSGKRRRVRSPAWSPSRAA